MKRWKLSTEVPEEAYEALPGFPSFLAAMLWRRGIQNEEEADVFLNPDWDRDVHDPFLFQDMQKAVDRILKAVEQKEKIVIHGDYDADGVSGSVIIGAALKELGADFDVFIPHREKEGYGINVKTILKLVDENTKVMITTDCGISNKVEIDLAVEKGIDVIITDHHSLPPVLPLAIAILHPLREGETYPFKWLTGGGVAFKLAQALWKAGGLAEGHDKWLTDMVSISTVADFGKLYGENRALVYYGLKVLNKTKRLGLAKLIENSSLGRRKNPIDVGGIGFQIAPRINAAGRMDHARLAFDLLTAQDAEFADKQARIIEGHNNDRRALTEKLIREALPLAEEQKDQHGILVTGEGWPAALCGLLASRIVNKFHRPVIVLGKNKEGKYVGSGRSIPGFDVIQALRDNSESLEKYGGHAEACGMTILSEEKVEAFRSGFLKTAEEKLKDVELIPFVEIEGELQLSEVNAANIDLLQKLEPFGVSNPKPKFLIKDARIAVAGCVGKESAHLSLIINDDEGNKLKLIAFRFGERADEFQVGARVDVLVELSMNEWNGYRSPQGQVVDLRLVTEKVAV